MIQRQALALAFALSIRLASQPVLGAQTPGAAAREVTILQIRVVSGEGSIHTAGTRMTQPLSVLISDETGRPVEGATVSFQLPDEGASGLFEGGLRTQIATTGTDGRASTTGIRWGAVTGSAEIRVTAVKAKARAGTLVSVFVTEPVATAKPAAAPTATKQGGGKGKWIALTLVIAGAAAGGLAAGLSQGGSNTPSQPAPPPVQIGVPSITIGRP